ncbi:hypothetical protein PoB_004642300, partial [Plakobranchus ocellatus]
MLERPYQILVCDLNAHSPSWGNRKSDWAGQTIEKITLDLGREQSGADKNEAKRNRPQVVRCCSANAAGRNPHDGSANRCTCPRSSLNTGQSSKGSQGLEMTGVGAHVRALPAVSALRSAENVRTPPSNQPSVPPIRQGQPHPATPASPPLPLQPVPESPVVVANAGQARLVGKPGKRGPLPPLPTHERPTHKEIALRLPCPLVSSPFATLPPRTAQHQSTSGSTSGPFLNYQSVEVYVGRTKFLVTNSYLRSNPKQHLQKDELRAMLERPYNIL